MGCQYSQLTQSNWIASGLQFLKGLQVNWKNCIKIVWIADRTQKQPLSQRNRSIFEPIHEFNCNPCQFCKFKGQSQNTVFFCNSFQFMNFNANQSIPMQFHGALQNLPQSSGCQSSPQLTQLIWIASGLWIYKGLQVNWKHCIKIAWIADQTQKTALLASDPSHFWANSQLAHDLGMPGTINFNCIGIASLERIAS